MDTLTMTLIFFAILGIASAIFFHFAEKKEKKHPKKS